MTTKPHIITMIVLSLAGLACGGFLPTPTATPAAPAATATLPLPTTTPTNTPGQIPTSTPGQIATSPPDTPSGLIAYTRIEDTFIDIFVVDPNNPADDFRFTNTPDIAIMPIWSPDNEFIAYYRFNPVTDTVSIHVIDLLNNLEDRAILADAGRPANPLSWSPDANYLVYSDDFSQIYRVDIAAGTRQNLTPNYTKWNSNPAWSPVGDQIIFITDREEGFNDDVWIMNADGSDMRVLVERPEWEDTDPAWSPDGKQVAFLRFGILTDANTPGYPGGLWMVDVATGTEHLVTDHPLGISTGTPVWSPDGQYIAYTEGSGVWVVDSNGGDPAQIADIPDEVKDLSWSPDSQAVVFTVVTNDGDSQMLHIARRDGSAITPLFETGNTSRAMWSNPFE